MHDFRDEYMSTTITMIKWLTRWHYLDGHPYRYFNQVKLASLLHLSVAQMSRVSTGVSSLSGERFYQLQKIYNEYKNSCTD